MPSITETHVRRLIDKVPAWKDRDIRIAALSGGLTNSNFRVDVDGKPYFVRIPGESADLLAIDRENEYHNARIAADLGIGPKIERHLSHDDMMVMEFIDGRTLCAADMQAPDMLEHVATVMTVLHDGPEFHRDFRLLRTIDYYLDVIRARRFALPVDFEERLPLIRRLQESLEATAIPPVPCHNDLLAENFILADEKLYVVDFEYSGNNDPCFELGNFAQEQEYDEAQIDRLCSAYFDESLPDMVARTKLNMIVSDVVWSLWATIQREISQLEFDFAGYGQNRWRRACAKFDSGVFAAWNDAL